MVIGRLGVDRRAERFFSYLAIVGTPFLCAPMERILFPFRVEFPFECFAKTLEKVVFREENPPPSIFNGQQ